MKKTPIWKKWWLWLAIVLFIGINLLITNDRKEQDQTPADQVNITDSNISTH
ncbi:hypothetical protein [Halalkalibacter nanhaiisediminis]|uniref:Uncharacterized protein n=1 Tax=Halalkalibacter nanhaiisediminis TaxID=688079 RepID=A0A562QQL8_9BACI|nr:hypothetical protein [Halalkalibacter nanhaiisediminis]TWI59048.1 hypothetical protein IQ10_00759 [Halalkalibacter nanhaiisediminis]